MDGRQLLDLLHSNDQRVKLAGQTYVLGVIDAVSWESDNTALERRDFCFSLSGNESAADLAEVVHQFVLSVAKRRDFNVDGFPANGLVRGALAERFPCRRLPYDATQAREG